MKKLLLIALLIMGCDKDKGTNPPPTCMDELNVKNCVELEELYETRVNALQEYVDNYAGGINEYEIYEEAVTEAYNCMNESGCSN